MIYHVKKIIKAVDEADGSFDRAQEVAEALLRAGLRVVAVERDFEAADGTRRMAHYGSGEQPWDAARRLGWAPAFAAANVLKYLRRTKEPEGDLAKARWYWRELRKLVAYKTSFVARDVRHDLQVELTEREFILLQDEKEKAL